MLKPYEELANAIIILAAEDYRNVCRILSLNPYNHNAIIKKERLLEFFRSTWFGRLTMTDPEILIERLDKEVM